MQASVTRPYSGSVQTTVRLTIAASGLGLSALAALHLLSPEFNPTWRMVSEYALGHHRWLLSVMFVSMAASSLALGWTLRPHLTARAGRIGLVILFISALGQALAAVFDVSQPLHGLAALLGIPTFPVAALLITRSLTKGTASSGAKQALWGAAHLTWISLILMVLMMVTGLAHSGGQMGPGVLIGLPNRLLLVANAVWLILAARQACPATTRHP
ncbi:DUF998 domain-containing protein [Deinococcus sp.]|uniref:DUF998 domain-containing protein n=1 Tax=Deinococcus sp. TaxID=47478 RepID=UPI003CC60D76